MTRAIAFLLLALAAAPAQARRAIFIQPPREVPVSRAMIAEQRCLARSRARTTQAATVHALDCALRFR